MLKSLKRLSACLLITVFIFGSISLTSAEAAMKKPGNARFGSWKTYYKTIDNVTYRLCDFDECTVYWNTVSGANAYETRCTWTDNSHNIGGILYGKYKGARIYGLKYQHVYQFQVRALKVNSKKKVLERSPWSNIVFITPWPKNLSAKLTSSTSTKVKLNWNIIYGSNGYNVFMATNPAGTWRWNLSTSTKATATSATIKKYRGSKLQKYKYYYVRVITRRKRNGVFCTVPAPFKDYWQYMFRIYNK